MEESVTKFCKICQTQIEEDFDFHLLKNDIRQKLVEFVPEIDFNLTRKFVICRQCITRITDTQVTSNVPFSDIKEEPERNVLNCIKEESGVDKIKEEYGCDLLINADVPKSIEKSYYCNDCGYCTDTKRKLMQHICKQHKKRPKDLESTIVKTLPFINDSIQIKEEPDTESTTNLTEEVLFKEDSNWIEEKIKEEFGVGVIEDGITDLLVVNKTDAVKPNDVSYCCHDCGHRTDSKQNFIEHVYTQHKKSKFVCGHCYYSTLKKSALRWHMYTHLDSKVKMYKCEHCSYCTTEKKSYNRHLIVHNKDKSLENLKCEKCGYTCSRRYYLLRHIRNWHKEGDLVTSYKCNECEYVTTYKPFLVKHVLSHKERKYKCTECNFTCNYQPLWRVHMRKHTGEKPYQCGQCERSFAAKSYLRWHVNTTHGDKCIKCEYIATYKQSFINHKCDCKKDALKKTYNSSDKLFRCTECNYCCKRSISLKNHMLKHIGEKPYQCDECDYKCARKAGLRDHKLNHTNEKPFKCTKCDYSCKRSTYLKEHMHKHTGEKPYQCDKCDYKCTHKRTLICHKLTHTDVKPFKCTECKYSCKRSTYLKDHMRKHTGEKPYHCDECDYKTGHRGSLFDHKLNHKNGKLS